MKQKNIRIISRTLGLVMMASVWSSATPKSYLYDHALLKFRSTDGLNLKATDNLTLTLWRADYYRHWPIKFNGASEWWGYDFYPSASYKLPKYGHLSHSLGGGLYFLMRYPNFQEWRPRLNLNQDLLLFGKAIIGLSHALEYRNYQNANEFERLRYRIRTMVSTPWGLSKLHISPYLYWEGYYQKTGKDDRVLGETPKYREAEIGLNSKLSPKVSFTVAEMFEYNPDDANIRGNYSSHRISTSFFYNVDLNPK